MQNPQKVKAAAAALKNLLPPAFCQASHAPCAIILGTGLSSLIRNFPTDLQIIPFTAIPGFPLPGVDSHQGAFAAGVLNGLPVIFQQGRCHLYEGRTPGEVVMGVRVLSALGARELIITNAAGGLNPLFEPGSLMCMTDLINHTGVSPLTGDNYDGDRFPDMTEPFPYKLRQFAISCGLGLGIRLNEGVYIGVHGPEMETRAETRMYRQWGADAIGMSTALEVIAASHASMQCLGISCITNRNLPDCMTPAPIAEIVAVAEKAGASLAALLVRLLENLVEFRQTQQIQG